MANEHTAVYPVLTEEEREELQRWRRRHSTAQALAKRAHIILLAEQHHNDAVVGDLAGCTRETAGKWRRRFVNCVEAPRTTALLDAPRPGTPRTITDDQIETVVVATLEATPEAATHWSRSMMAERVGLSASSVGRIWRAFGLRPHRSESFQLSNDPLLIEKVRDIVGLYLHPPTCAVVLCVDEKPQMQAVERKQPIVPMTPGSVEQQTHEYTRHGTVDLFAALDIVTGEVLGKLSDRHRAEEFREFLDQIDEAVPAELDVHLVLDNASSHKTPMIQRWLVAHPRFQVHFTPTHASWMNQVERFFAGLAARQLKRGSFRSTDDLEQAIRAFIDKHNEKPKPFIWVKTADQILASIKRRCERISGGGH